MHICISDSYLTPLVALPRDLQHTGVTSLSPSVLKVSLYAMSGLSTAAYTAVHHSIKKRIWL